MEIRPSHSYDELGTSPGDISIFTLWKMIIPFSQFDCFWDRRFQFTAIFAGFTWEAWSCHSPHVPFRSTNGVTTYIQSRLLLRNDTQAAWVTRILSLLADGVTIREISHINSLTCIKFYFTFGSICQVSSRCVIFYRLVWMNKNIENIYDEKILVPMIV